MLLPMARTPRKPDPFKVGRMSITPERGPDERGQWWWRGYWYVGGKTCTHTFSWGTREAIERQAIAFAAGGLPSPGRAQVDAPVTVRALLECWKAYQRKMMEGGQLAERSFDVYSHACARLGKPELAGQIGDVLAILGRAMAMLEQPAAAGPAPDFEPMTDPSVH